MIRPMETLTTLPAPPPLTPRQKWLRGLECGLLFFAIPGLLYLVRQEMAHRAVPLVLLAGAGVAVYLWRRPEFDRQSLWRLRGMGPHVKRVLLMFVVPALALTMATWLVWPQLFLAFPLARPPFWALVMLLYPLLAAYPQELVFRAFFFQRYQPLVSHPLGLVALNALSFGLAHGFYGNWLAPLLSTLGGALFAYRYLSSGSLVVASLEHGLWGNFLFTVGLGWFFYSGHIY